MDRAYYACIHGRQTSEKQDGHQRFLTLTLFLKPLELRESLRGARSPSCVALALKSSQAEAEDGDFCTFYIGVALPTSLQRRSESDSWLLAGEGLEQG
jgi:hypothetical protein